MNKQLDKFIEDINSKNTKNIRFVHIKVSRQCRECKNTIKNGELTLTINKRGQGRT